MAIDMSKLASGAAYGASAGTTNSLLTKLSPDEWSAVGVLAGIVVALITLCINWYYKRKATLAQIKALQRWPSRLSSMRISPWRFPATFAIS